MLYGIIFDTVRDGILGTFGPNLWKRIVQEVNLPSDTFDFDARYDVKLLMSICDCMIEILNDGRRDTYLEFFGTNFMNYFYRHGFDKILRVSGRTFRDFLFTIDQLHDSNRYTFPKMHYPLFHVADEDEKGVTLVYKSVRHGLTYFAIGALKAVASKLFHENDINVIIRDDLSTVDYSHIVFWVQFNNEKYEVKRLSNFPSLPDLNGATFFRVFPFSILMDSTLRILRMGNNIMKVFPDDTILIGRLLNEVFRLVRPEIHVEWDKILSHRRHDVFLMENRLPLRVGPSGKIRLKGQMKYIQNKSMLWFLCYPVLESTDDMISSGLQLIDLNLFDSTSDFLTTGIHQERELAAAILRQHFWTEKIPNVGKKLSICRKRNQGLLYSTMPKHIALLLQSGIQVTSICECQPLVTIMFVNVMDIKILSSHLDASQAISCVNNAISLFDTIAEKFDVFKVEIKIDGSYMVVAGIHDQSYMIDEENRSRISLLMSAIEDGADDEHPRRFNSTETIATLSLELLRASQHVKNPITNEPYGLKLGFHSGTAIGGVIGTRNYQYCLFGDTVKTASQIATTGEIGRIHLSQAAYGYLVAGKRFTIEHRGQVDIKDEGPSDTYWLTGINEKSSPTRINKSATLLKCPFSGQDFNN